MIGDPINKLCKILNWDLLRICFKFNRVCKRNVNIREGYIVL